jgi:hypothetical protein
MSRGRRSIVSLSVVPALPGKRRPSPPPNMSAAEVAAWQAVVSAMPAHWFYGAESVLARYCVQVASCEVMERRLRAMWDGSGPIDQTLLAAHARATTTLVKLAQALRLSPGSRYTPRSAAGRLSEAKSGQVRPWDPQRRR